MLLLYSSDSLLYLLHPEYCIVKLEYSAILDLLASVLAFTIQLIYTFYDILSVNACKHIYP